MAYMFTLHFNSDLKIPKIYVLHPLNSGTLAKNRNKSDPCHGKYQHKGDFSLNPPAGPIQSMNRDVFCLLLSVPSKKPVFFRCFITPIYKGLMTKINYKEIPLKIIPQTGDTKSLDRCGSWDG